MQIELRRHTKGQRSTLGDLFIDGQLVCHTLEDVVRDLGPHGEGKVPGETAIPPGTYPVIVNMSPRFGRLFPRLLVVPFFDGILIHKGNRSEDTHGCILVGMEIGGPDLLLRSTEAFDLVFPMIQGAYERLEEIQITVLNAFGGRVA